MAARLKVLLITPDFPPEKGGIQILMGRLVEFSPGLDVRVLTLGQEGAEEYDRAAGFEVRRVGGPRSERRLATLGLNARAVAEARGFRPDVILSGHVITSLGVVALRRLLRVPLVVYVHADELRMRGGVATPAVRHADAIVAVSRYTRDLVVERGADPERVHVIPPGVDLPAPPRPRPPGPPVLLTVASLLFRYKGHDVMTRAMPLIRARVPEARWVVTGDGPFREVLENAVDAYGLGEAIDVRGRVSDAERDELLETSTAFCMPSRIPADGFGGEGFGIAYMEAAAHWMPTIGGNVAGALDAVIDGVTGLLVDPTDHLALAAAATELLADPERAAEMGAAGRAHAERHAWPLIAGRLEELLREVADKD